jgi:hypothetical protein
VGRPAEWLLAAGVQAYVLRELDQVRALVAGGQTAEIARRHRTWDELKAEWEEKGTLGPGYEVEEDILAGRCHTREEIDAELGLLPEDEETLDLDDPAVDFTGTRTVTFVPVEPDVPRHYEAFWRAVAARGIPFQREDPVYQVPTITADASTLKLLAALARAHNGTLE